jgi:hypothetical protein
MLRILTFAFFLFPIAALAQQPDHPHRHAMPEGPATTKAMPINGSQMMDHMQLMHHHGMPPAGPRNSDLPSQPGQAAFAAIQEVVQILEADQRTDWSKVDIEALRQHLIDMSNVTLLAHVSSESMDGGMRFTVTGDAEVSDSIRRMTSAHAATMDGINGWHFDAKDTEGGSIFEVRVPPQDVAKLKGLGFIGVMTRGMHHQEHHLMIARGEHPHN